MEKMCYGMVREICGELSAILTKEAGQFSTFYRPAYNHTDVATKGGITRYHCDLQTAELKSYIKA